MMLLSASLNFWRFFAASMEKYVRSAGVIAGSPSGRKRVVCAVCGHAPATLFVVPASFWSGTSRPSVRCELHSALVAEPTTPPRFQQTR